jgi:predicted DNA-binding mobile mystery protein A
MKNKEDQEFITSQISRRLEQLRTFSQETQGIKSWSEYLRIGLGMTLEQLAKRLGVSQSTVSAAEKSEKEKRITLKKLEALAEALECDLVYAFIPRKKLEDIIDDKAAEKTLVTISRADKHMGLEDQKVIFQNDKKLEILKEKTKFSKHLWD